MKIPSALRIPGSLVIISALCMIIPSATYALINPNFTPVHLVKQAGQIARMEFKDKPADGKITGTVAAVLKGKVKDKTVKFDFTITPFKEKAEMIMKRLTAADPRPMLFFVGEFQEEGEGGGMEMGMGGGMGGFGDDMGGGDMDGEGEEGGGGERKAFLNVDSDWIRFFEGKNGVWEMEDIDTHMLATWHGSPDMLLRCVNYILKDKDADVPSAVNAAWAEHVQVGTVKGKISAMMRVDLTGQGAYALYVASDNGDKLYAWDKKKKAFQDITAKTKLSAASTVSTWADVDGNSRLDLLSWNGKALTLHSQADDGTFKASPMKVAGNTGPTCLGLAVTDSGNKGRPAVIFSRPDTPLVLTLDGNGGMKATALTFGTKPDDPGGASACLVADFDGDNRPDILQPFVNNGLFYKGTGPAAFAAATPTAVGVTQPAAQTAIGDFDADGRLDIVAGVRSFPMLWHNYPGLKWKNMISETGEPSYIAKGGAVGCDTGDINDDGRCDFLVLYAGPGSRQPQVFFNRGFRSFGHAHQPIDLQELGVLPQSEKGQQAGFLKDLDGDGAQDMALALMDGSIWVFFRDTMDPLSVQVALPLAGLNAGPVRVWAMAGGRNRGAWNVVAGTSEAFFGQIFPGPVTVHWTLPGGKEQKKDIFLEDKSKHFVIGE